MKKIGLLSLALVLALGTLGIGYAMWQDTVTIEGTVNTGSVDLDIEELSATWVYKVPGGEIVVNHAYIPGIHATNDPAPPVGGILVASATADIVSLTDYAANIVTMTFDNIFPTEVFIVADVLLHYTGSIPVHVTLSETFGGDDLSPYLVQDWWLSTDDGVNWVPLETEMLQLHYCDLLRLEVYLDPVALQLAGKAAQGLSGTFTKTITVYQWNEEPE